MGFGFRKSLNLGGGFRLNFSKSGIGISAGFKGFRVGIGPGGARVRASIPGTGLYYEERLATNRSKAANARVTSTADLPPLDLTEPRQIELGFWQKLFTPPEELSFVEGINLLLKNQREDALAPFRQAVAKKPDFADAHFCLALITSGSEQLQAISAVLEHRENYRRHFQKYRITLGAEIPITDELKLMIYNDDRGLILLAVEVFQEHDLLDRAIELLTSSPWSDDPAIILSLGELYFDAGRYEDSVRTLQQLVDDDAIGATALLYQGLAFRAMGHPEAAAEVLKKVLRRKKGRSRELLLAARYQLALTYEMTGETKKARKEYEKVLTEELDYRDVREKLKQLSGEK